MQTIEVVSTVMAPIEGELVLVVVEWSCGSTQLTLKKKVEARNVLPAQILFDCER